MKDAIEENITREIFDNTLYSLISLISNGTCLSLRKHNAFENSHLQGNFNNSTEVLIEDFDKLKKTFFAEAKSFKDNVVDSLMVLKYLRLAY